MVYSDSAEDYRPVMHLRGHPINLTLLLIVLHTSAMVGFSIATASGYGSFFEPLSFSSVAIWHHEELWRLFTYPLVAAPSLGFVVQMLMLYWFGPEVERFVGTRSFLKLYIALIAIPAIFLAAAGYRHSLHYEGASDLLFGFFIAFVAIYPNVEILFLRMTAKWLAWILLGIYSLVYLTEHQIVPLAMLWLCSGVGYAGMRLAGVGGGFDWLDSWREKRVAGRNTRRMKAKNNREKQWKDSIDPILEKISSRGIGSLTTAERAALESARSALLKRDKRK
jgi:membrane associated rhomboid family serine protease